MSILINNHLQCKGKTKKIQITKILILKMLKITCGDVGNRIRVHTRKSYAFYMFSLISIFVLQQQSNKLCHNLILNLVFIYASRNRINYFWIILHHYIDKLQKAFIQWCLVLSHCKRIKQLIYYSSIRQREPKCFCQLLFRPMFLSEIVFSLRAYI